MNLRNKNYFGEMYRNRRMDSLDVLKASASIFDEKVIRRQLGECEAARGSGGGKDEVRKVKMVDMNERRGGLRSRSVTMWEVKPLQNSG